jgi:hypothetical protein
LIGSPFPFFSSGEATLRCCALCGTDRVWGSAERGLGVGVSQ